MHENNAWAKAYKLEYLNEDGIIIKEPALNAEEIKPRSPAGECLEVGDSKFGFACQRL